MGIIAASRLRIGKTPMFTNAVAYYKLDETTGDAIDLVNAYNGTLNGSISRNGEYYTFDAQNEYVEIADEDDFSFTDGTNNIDFVIKTEVIVDEFNVNQDDRAWLVSKRQSLSSGVQEWQLIFFQSKFLFVIYSSSNSSFTIETDFIPTFGQKYILGVTLNSNSVSLFIDGVIVETKTLTSGFEFFNGTSVVKFGDETFLTGLNLKGKLKETVIVKGNGWDAETISDNYNSGAGVTYNP
jgi:hypothetical protein